MSDGDGQAQVIPGSAGGNRAVGAEDVALRRSVDCAFHGLADLLGAAAGDHTLALKAAHEGPVEQAQDFLRADIAAGQLQAGVDDMPWIINKRSQVAIRKVIIADVQDIEDARAVDFFHQRQVVGADALFKQRGVVKAANFIALG